MVRPQNEKGKNQFYLFMVRPQNVTFHEDSEKRRRAIKRCLSLSLSVVAKMGWLWRN